jgi:L-iditol 2-dehydrogenase
VRFDDDLPEPEHRDGEVLLRVRAVGICGSDLHYYREGGIGPAKIEAPFIPGHEFAGEVIGGTGEPHGLPDGTLVAVDPAQNCGECGHCRAGHPNLCPRVRFLGSPGSPAGVDGGLCERISVPARTVFPLPFGFDPVAGALLEPLGVALHALDITRCPPLSGVAIVGGGPIGLLIAQAARAAGALRVRVVEPLAWRRAVALALGADTVHADYREVLTATADGELGPGEDCVFEATNSAEGPEHAARIARIGGRVTLVGIPEDDRFMLTASNARRKGLTVRFSRRMGHIYPRALELVRQQRVRLDPLVTHLGVLAEVPALFSMADRMPEGFVKLVILPNFASPAGSS